MSHNPNRRGLLIPLLLLLVLAVGVTTVLVFLDGTAATVPYDGESATHLDQIHDRAIELLDAEDYRSALAIIEAVAGVALGWYAGIETEIRKCRRAIETDPDPSGEQAAVGDQPKLEQELARARDQFRRTSKALEQSRQRCERYQHQARGYQDGLERCVAELNRQQGSRQGGRRSTARPDWIFVREPEVTNVANQTWLIDGTVHNANDLEVAGYVYVDFTCSGDQEDSERIRMVIPAESVRDYHAEFRPVQKRPPCSASAEWSVK